MRLGEWKSEEIRKGDKGRRDSIRREEGEGEER